MERAIKERMSLQDVDALMPHDIINPKPVIAAIKNSSAPASLSQFMDQTNPLAEITHNAGFRPWDPAVSPASGRLRGARCAYDPLWPHLPH